MAVRFLGGSYISLLHTGFPCYIPDSSYPNVKQEYLYSLQYSYSRLISTAVISDFGAVQQGGSEQDWLSLGISSLSAIQTLHWKVAIDPSAWAVTQ